MRYQRRLHSIRERRKKKRRISLWQRGIAAAAMFMLLLGCVYHPGLQNVLAEETSGYRIDAAYDEGTNQVTLAGNTQDVKTGVTLKTLTDQDGQEYDPAGFQKTVAENGEYSYELTYSQTNAQTGAEEEKTETLEIIVDQIQAPAEETGAEETADAADTIPVSELQTAYQAMSAQERATAAGSMNVKQYAEEKNLTEIGSVEFSGGSLEEGQGPEWTPGDGTGVTRTFASAGYVLNSEDGSTPHLITGLFPWKNEQGTYDWYYTADGQEGSGQDYGTIMVGHRLPDTATVRFYYRLSSPEYTLTIAENFSNLGFDYMVEGAAGGTYPAGTTRSYKIMAGDTITFSVKLPGTYLGARVTLSGLNGNPVYGLQRQANDSIGNYTKLATLADPTNYWYEIEFIMPAAAVTTSLQETGWSGGANRSFAVYLPDSESSPNASQNFEFGFTRLFTTHITTPGGGINWSKQIGYNAGRSIPNNPYGARLGMGYYKTDTAGYRQNDSGNVTTRDSASDMATSGYPSKSTESGVGGGAPYTHSEWYGWREGSTSYQNGETVKQSSDNTQTGNYSLNLISAYADPWSTSTTLMAKGQYYPGQTVGFRLEMAKGRTTGTSGNTLKYYYRPGNIMLDVYSGDRTITDKDFERYTISLSDLKGVLSGGSNDSSDLPTSKSISVAGGTITIKCISYGTTTFNPQNPTGNTSEANQYGGQWNGGFGNQSYYNKYGHNDDKGNASLLASAPIFAYYIEVKGLNRPFKISYRHASGAQQNNVIQTMNGVEEGTYASSGVTGSTISVNSGSSAVTQPLVEGFLWNNNEKINSSYNDIAVALNEGYGQLKIQYVDEGGGPLSTGKAAFQSIDNQGRYVYRLTNSRESNTISQIQITAQPLTFTTEYIYNNQDYTSDAGGAVTLSYDSSNGHVRSLKIPVSAIPKGAAGFLQGFTVRVLGPAGSVWISDLQNPEGESTWDIGDEIQVEYVYEKLKATNAIRDGINNFRIQLIANMATGSTGEFVSANYTIYNQHTYFDGAAYVSAGNYEQSLLNNNFYDRTDSIRVQKDVEIMLVGFNESYVGSENATMTGKKYILDETRSATHATVTTNGAHIGNVYYAVATEIEIKIPTDLQADTNMKAYVDAINHWNDQWRGVYHSGLSMVTPFTRELPENLPDFGTKRFSGWRVVQSAYANQDGTTDDYESRVFDYPIVSSSGTSATLNLNMLGRDGDSVDGGLAAWRDAFTGSGNGVLTLVPYYVEATKPITLTEDGTLTGGMGSTKVYANADGSHNHSLESTFYMKGEPIDTNTTVNYAIYAKEEGKENWGRTETGTINLSNGNFSTRQNTADSNGISYDYLNGSSAVADITTTTSGNTSITLKISNITSSLGGTGTQYRVYMWNEANGEVTSDSDYDTGQLLDASTLSRAARDWYSLTIIYPFTSREVTSSYSTDAYSSTSDVTIQTGGTDGKAALTTTLYYWGKWDDYKDETLNLALYRTGYGSGGSTNSNYFADMWIKAAYTITGEEDTADGSISLASSNSSNTRFMSEAVTIRAADNATAGRGSVTITVELLDESRNGDTTNQDRLRYAYEDATSPSQRVWKVYGWNLANANKAAGNITGGTLGTGGQDNLPATLNGAKVALVDHSIHITPKAVSQSSGNDLHVTVSSPVSTSEGQAFDLTATFKVDELYPIDLQTGAATASVITNDQADIRDGKLHTALLKQKPADTAWKIWISDSTAVGDGLDGGSPKVQLVSVEPVSASGSGVNRTASQVTVTYRILNVNNSITKLSDDGAKYESFAWNGANDSTLSGITGETLENYLANGTGSSYSKVPSVITGVKIDWQDPSYYVYIPAAIVLTDATSGRTAQADATVRYKNADEGNTAATLPDISVAVDDGETLANTEVPGKTMITDICNNAGVTCTAGPADPTYGNMVYIGKLSSTSGIWRPGNSTVDLPKESSFRYRITAPTNEGDPKGTTYTGILHYLFEIDTSATP